MVKILTKLCKIYNLLLMSLSFKPELHLHCQTYRTGLPLTGQITNQMRGHLGWPIRLQGWPMPLMATPEHAPVHDLLLLLLLLLVFL